MHFISAFLVILLLGANVVYAQNVTVPSTSGAAASSNTSQSSPSPVIVNNLPLAPLMPLVTPDPALTALETRVRALRRDDYRGMTSVAVAALNCPVALPFEPTPTLNSRIITISRLLLRRAAEKGIAEAQIALARNYLDGRCGAVPDYIEGYAWMKAALYTNPDISPNAGISYARSKLSQELLPQAEYQASIYINDFSKPYSLGERIKPELPCPASINQVGVFLAGDDFSPARSALLGYNGKGYPTTVVTISTPQGCTKLRELNRFRVRFAARATVSDVNSFLRDHNLCITNMMAVKSDEQQNSREEIDFTDVVLSAASLPQDVSSSDQIISELQRYSVFQNAVPLYEGEAECPAGTR